MTSTGVRSGLLLTLLGAFLIMRTITQDHTGRTLVDRLLGRPATAGGVAHTATQIAPLPTRAEQKKQIAKLGYVTDNVVGSVGTTKAVTGPAVKLPSFGNRFFGALQSEPSLIQSLLP